MVVRTEDRRLGKGEWRDLIATKQSWFFPLIRHVTVSDTQLNSFECGLWLTGIVNNSQQGDGLNYRQVEVLIDT